MKSSLLTLCVCVLTLCVCVDIMIMCVLCVDIMCVLCCSVPVIVLYGLKDDSYKVLL